MHKNKNQFVRLDYQLIDSKAWINLSNSAKIAYIDLKRCRYKINHKGKMINCGEEIEFGFSDCLNIKNPNSFVKAIVELRIAGLIELIKPGSFQPKRKAVYKLSHKWTTR